MSDSELGESLFFSVKVGKSYKNGGWALKRDETMGLIPKLVYEDDCDIVVDGIHSKAKLNIVPRIFYDRKGHLPKHLKKLSEEGKERVNVELLLKNTNVIDENTELNNAYREINRLNHLIENKNSQILKLSDEIDNINTKYDSDSVEVLKLQDKINHLESLVENQNKQFDLLFDEIVQLETKNNESLKIRLFFEDENKKLKDKIEKLSKILSE